MTTQSPNVTTARPRRTTRTVSRSTATATATATATTTTARPRIALDTSIETQSFIAAGGMASVFRAHDHRLEREVAMKVLKQGASELVRMSFAHEAKLMARLDHPGIVGVYGLSAPNADAQVFTMKLVEGQTLSELVDRNDPPRGRALAALLRGVLRMCETLAYAHDRGVIHRDLKPDNVMLGRYGECYIMDWGVALERGPDGQLRDTVWAGRPGEVIGTPAFMAPEQACGRNDAIDPRTDVFGLGGILYFILTGRPPYTCESVDAALSAAREARIEPPELSSGRSIPARLSDIVTKALQADPGRRYQSAMHLRSALEQFLSTGEWFTRQRFAAGELIVREGEHGDRAYIVEAGECEVFRSDEHGEATIRRIGPGEVIGELALFTPSGRTASIRAITPITLLEVTRDSLEQELPEGSWTRQIIDTLAQRFVSIDQAQESSVREFVEPTLDLEPEPEPTLDLEPEPTLELAPEPTPEPSPAPAPALARERKHRSHEVPRPPAKPASAEPTARFVAKVIGAIVAMTGLGLLLVKILAAVAG